MPINNRDSEVSPEFWIRKVADQVNQAENNHSRWITLETKQVKEFLSMVGDCTKAAECRYFVERNEESKFIGMSQFDWKVTDRLTGADVAYSHMQSIADQLAASLNRERGGNMPNHEPGESAAPKRIQRKREKGWRMPPNTVYVGRPTKWGNPHKAGWGRTRSHAVELYRDHARSKIFAEPHWVRELGGKDLACWCPLDQPCHADILLEIANVKS